MWGLETAGVNPVQWLVNYGVAGVIIALLVTGFLRTRSEVQGLQQRVEELRREVQDKDRAMQALVQQVMATLPQLNRTAQLVEQMPRNTEAELLRRLEVLTDKIEQVGDRDA